MQDTNSPTTRQSPERIPGELDADYRARCRRANRAVRWVGKGHRRHRQVTKRYPDVERPAALIDQNEGRIVSVQLIRKGDAE